MQVTGNALTVDDGNPDGKHASLLNHRYRVIREIGGGGMSITLLARDTAIDRTVVLKTGFSNKTDFDVVAQQARFEREAAALERLKHPNVVELLDRFTLSDGRPVLVLEHVNGATLQQCIDADGLVPCSEFIPIASQILKALQHIHAKGSVLRDIKPSNVMLCAKQRHVDVVKIIDFGLTRLFTGEDKITLDGGVGTPGFIPSEEIRGETVTALGDIYSLGALFYYALSGVLPFEGKAAAEVLYKQAHERPRSLASVLPKNAGVPDGVVRMVDDCLSPNPQERPASAVTMMELLIDALPARYFKLRKREVPGPVPPASAAMESDTVELIPIRSSAEETPPSEAVPPFAEPELDGRNRRTGLVLLGLGAAAIAVAVGGGRDARRRGVRPGFGWQRTHGDGRSARRRSP